MYKFEDWVSSRRNLRDTDEHSVNDWGVTRIIVTVWIAQPSSALAPHSLGSFHWGSESFKQSGHNDPLCLDVIFRVPCSRFEVGLPPWSPRNVLISAAKLGFSWWTKHTPCFSSLPSFRLSPLHGISPFCELRNSWLNRLLDPALFVVVPCHLSTSVRLGTPPELPTDALVSSANCGC